MSHRPAEALVAVAGKLATFVHESDGAVESFKQSKYDAGSIAVPPLARLGMTLWLNQRKPPRMGTTQQRHLTSSSALTNVKCYLCGDEKEGDRYDYDHVPPKRFFPRLIRARKCVQLATLLTHTGCNQSYELDEEYFFTAIVPLAALGKAVVAQYAFEDLLQALGRSQGLRLLQS